MDELHDNPPRLGSVAQLPLETIERRPPSHEHLVRFYEDDEGLGRAVVSFVEQGLDASEPVLIIATAVHREAFERRIIAGGYSPEQVVFIDARKLLATFMRAGEPEPALFDAEVGALVASLNGPEGRTVRAYGEMVDVLWSEGSKTAALRLEELWNELQARYPFTLLCAYSMASFYKEPGSMQPICALHTHVAGDGARGIPTDMDALPEYARRLSLEVARRAEVEVALRDALSTLRRREQEATENEQRFRDFVENAPVGLHQVGPDGTILWANSAELDMLGYTRDELVGQPITKVHADDGIICDILARLRSGEELHDYEARLRTKDGSIRHVLISSNVHSRDGEFIHTRCFTRDITDKRIAEQALRDRESYRAAADERAQRLLRITSAVADAVTTAEVFEAVVDHVREGVGASSTGLWLLDESGRTVKLVRSLGYSEAARAAFASVPIDLEPSFPALDALRRGEPIWIDSRATMLRDYPGIASTISPNRAYRVSCLPLISNGRTLGVLGLTIEEERVASEEERSFLLLVARYASQALERVRLLESERRSRAAADEAASRMAVLSHASRVFGDANPDREHRLDEIVLELGNVFHGCVAIGLLEDGHVRPSAVHHPDPEAKALLEQLAASRPLRVGEGVTGTVASTGTSVLLPAPEVVANSAAPQFREFTERFPMYAIICAPLRARGRIIGTVTAARTRAGETFTSADLQLLEGLAERAASAIEHSRLHAEAHHARVRAEHLYRFAHAAVSAEKLADVLDAALDAIAATLGIHRTAVLLFDDADVMRFRAWRDLSEKYRQTVEGHSPWPRTAVAPQPVLIPDVRDDASLAAYQSLFQAEGIRSLAFIPLVTRGRLLGKFMLYYAEPHEYSTNEIALVTAIGNHLASVTARFEAVAALEQTIRYNELFAGVLAHDLRNPLSAIMTAAQLLLMRQEGEGDRNSKPLSRIMWSGQRITRMIEQLLDFTKARVGGGIDIQPRDANLAELCNQAVSELELVYPDRRIKCSIVGDQQGCWDPDRLLQIISNLLANAIQHGADEYVDVHCDGTQSDRVALEIRNRGTIPSELLTTLFDPFRGTHHRRDHSRGLGLGLFIVKELTRAHGGTVEVASSKEVGTTFTLLLPRRGRTSAVDG